MSEHTFDKLRALDCTFAEFEIALEQADVVEEHEIHPVELKELLLVLNWRRPLHVVVIVDEIRREERVLTVYEPEPDKWSADYRRRQ